MSDQIDPKFEKLIDGVVKVEKSQSEAAQAQSDPRPWMNFASDDIPAEQRPSEKKESELEEKTFTREKANEDYVAALVEFENGVRGTLEVDRSIFGPQSQMAFEMNGSKGAAAWNLETMNELQLYLPEETPADGYLRVLSGDGFPRHGNIVPGGGNPIGYEDLKVFEDLEFLKAVVEDRPAAVSFADALATAEVEAAMTRSWESGTWENVTSLRID